MMSQQLKKPQVFISSKIDELKDERLMVRECVKQFGFETAMFEGWGARSSGLRQTYIDEVMNSNLYVGIFDKEYSAPTIEEYETARYHNIDIRIYVKKLVGDLREKKLQSFIETISDPDEGHVLCYFDDIMDLREKVKNDIACWIAGTVLCKTDKKLIKISKTEFYLAIDSMVANKIFIETEGKIQIDSDFKNEFAKTLTDIIHMEKLPLNSVITRERLLRASILALLRRMGNIHQDVLPIYVEIFTVVLSGGRLNNLIANLKTNLAKVAGKDKQAG